MVRFEAVAQVPIFLLAMVFSYIPALEPALNASVGCFTANEIVQWVLCTPVQAWQPCLRHPPSCHAVLRRDRKAGSCHPWVELEYACWSCDPKVGSGR